MYGLAQFFGSSMMLVSGLYIPSQHALSAAALVALCAAAMFLFGQRLGVLLFKKRGLLPWDAFPHPGKISGAAATLYAAVALAYAALQNLWGFAPNLNIRNIINGLVNPELAFLLLLFLHFNRPGSIRRWVVPSMFAALLVLGIAGGMMEGAVAPVYVFFLSSYLWKGQTKVRWLVALWVVFLVLNPAKYKYRSLQGWGQGEQVQTSLQERLGNWGEALQSTWNDPFAKEDSLQRNTGRISAIVPLAQVIDWTPSIVPYNRGAGMGTALIYFFPRFIWSSKPVNTDLLVNRYATTFYITTYEGTKNTTTGIFQPADGYWDWGLPGAMSYPCLYGILVGGIFLGLRKGTAQVRLIGALFTVSFFQGLVSFGIIISSLVTLFAFTWVVLKGLTLLSQVSLSPRSQSSHAAARSLTLK
jgi:hypothetical protein